MNSGSPCLNHLIIYHPVRHWPSKETPNFLWFARPEFFKAFKETLRLFVYQSFYLDAKWDRTPKHTPPSGLGFEPDIQGVAHIHMLVFIVGTVQLGPVPIYYALSRTLPYI